MTLSSNPSTKDRTLKVDHILVGKTYAGKNRQSADNRRWLDRTVSDIIQENGNLKVVFTTPVSELKSDEEKFMKNTLSYFLEWVDREVPYGEIDTRHPDDF